MQKFPIHFFGNRRLKYNPLASLSYLYKLSDINLHDVPWLVCGNFNIICNPEDKLGGRPFLLNDSVSIFCDFIFRSELLDLGFKGPKFI